MFRVQSYLVIV